MKALASLIAALFLLANAPLEQADALMRDGKKAEAFELVSSEAEKGDAKAVTYLAWFYDNGHHVEQDLAKAAELYAESAQRGESYAQWRYGVMIDQGITDGTPEMAVKLFELASEQGSTNAMTSLAVMYASGRGVPQDFTRTRQYYEQAAMRGNPHALRGIGLLYNNGEGVEQDLVEAMAYFMVARGWGSESAIETMEATAEVLSEEEYDRAAIRANEIAKQYQPRSEG